MVRGKNLILISHCILNQNAVIRDWERASGAFGDIIRILLDHDIGILQLPCPEFSYLGESRPPLTKSEYNTPEYLVHCSHLVALETKSLQEYFSQGYRILGVLGIAKSPSCDTQNDRGLFLDTLLSRAAESGVHLESIDVSVDYLEGHGGPFIDKLKTFILQHDIIFLDQEKGDKMV